MEPGSGRLQIRVGRQRCQGRARCVAIAPGLFGLDEVGKGCAIGDGTVPPGLEEEAWLAEAFCPVNAIEVTEQV
jgi:ferredoxin